MRFYRAGQLFESRYCTWHIQGVERKTLDGHTFMSHNIKKYDIRSNYTEFRSISFKKLTKFINKLGISLEVICKNHFDDELFNVE